jgi:hypothetical protein
VKIYPVLQKVISKEGDVMTFLINCPGMKKRAGINEVLVFHMRARKTGKRRRKWAGKTTKRETDDDSFMRYRLLLPTA